jgi:hypothetical protein
MMVIAAAVPLALMAQNCVAAHQARSSNRHAVSLALLGGMRWFGWARLPGRAIEGALLLAWPWHWLMAGASS